MTSAAAKRYRIEQTLRPSETRPPSPGDAHGGQGADETAAEILATVRELKRLFDPARHLATDALDGYRKDVAELYQLRTELDAMKEAIASTKREIVSLRRTEEEGKGMRRVAGELDAVVGATEDATTAILAAVEDIEANANMLRAAGAATGNNDCVGAILDRVVGLYEACNFQDLTGQRISKIVNVLVFVEGRIDSMIAVWGGLDAFKDLVGAGEGAPPARRAEDQALLNGPKLDGDPGHVSQNDIDALFV